MKSDPGQSLQVRSLSAAGRGEVNESLTFVDGDGELVPPPVLGDEPDWIDRLVHPSCDADEVGKRQAAIHSGAEASIVCVVGVLPAILVPQDAVRSDVVGVWRRLVRRSECRPYREGGGEPGRLPDAGLHNQPHWSAVEDEGVDQGRWKGAVGAAGKQVVEMSEHDRSQRGVHCGVREGHGELCSTADVVVLDRLHVGQRGPSDRFVRLRTSVQRQGPSTVAANASSISSGNSSISSRAAVERCARAESCCVTGSRASSSLRQTARPRDGGLLGR